MRRVVLAVEFLHEQGIIHRDLKPANILVGPDLEPKLLDFGLALDLGGHERLSQIGEVAGTPEYLSPEQARGDQALDARSDVFSLGAVLYELLTGAPPFRGDTVADLLRRIREEDPVLPRRRDSRHPRRSPEHLSQGPGKGPRAALRLGPRDGDDLRRFLAGEAVLAAPAAYSRLIGDKVGQHCATWKAGGATRLSPTPSTTPYANATTGCWSARTPGSWRRAASRCRR
jgi:serine/threonine protein kinase